MTPAMAYRGGRTVQRPDRRPAGARVALAGLALAVAGCGSALPLGPALAAAPAPRHLAAAIVMEPGRSDPGPSGTRCAAGSVALSGPGIITTSPANAPPANPASTTMCFRLLGKPVTFTSAGVTLYQRPAGSKPVQHPAMWGLSITLPSAEAAVLAAVTTKLAGTQDQLAIIVAGQTWGLPVALRPLTHGEFVIGAQSRNQALQLERVLLQPA
jgi:hypothetical protein